MRRDNDEIKERLDHITRQTTFLRRVVGLEAWPGKTGDTGIPHWAPEELYDLLHVALVGAEEALQRAVNEWQSMKADHERRAA